MRPFGIELADEGIEAFLSGRSQVLLEFPRFGRKGLCRQINYRTSGF
jgi:hypothetical protein